MTTFSLVLFVISTLHSPLYIIIGHHLEHASANKDFEVLLTCDIIDSIAVVSHLIFWGSLYVKGQIHKTERGSTSRGWLKFGLRQ